VGAPERASGDCSQNAFFERNSLCADWLISQRLAETGSRQDGPEAGLRVCKRGEDSERLRLDRQDSRRISRTASCQRNAVCSGHQARRRRLERPRAPRGPVTAKLGAVAAQAPGIGTARTWLRGPPRRVPSLLSPQARQDRWRSACQRRAGRHGTVGRDSRPVYRGSARIRMARRGPTVVLRTAWPGSAVVSREKR
jgi:hypothetical protein